MIQKFESAKIKFRGPKHPPSTTKLRLWLLITDMVDDERSYHYNSVLVTLTVSHKNANFSMEYNNYRSND